MRINGYMYSALANRSIATVGGGAYMLCHICLSYPFL